MRSGGHGRRSGPWDLFEAFFHRNQDPLNDNEDDDEQEAEEEAEE